MENRLLALAGILPCADILVVLVITECLTVGCLHLYPEVTSAGLVAVESITGHQFADLEEVVYTESLLKLLVELIIGTGYIHILHILSVEVVNLLDSLLETLLVTGHADFLPHDVTEFLMVIVNRLSTFVVDEVVDTLLDSFLRLVELRSIGVDLGLLYLMREIVSDCVRENKISVSKTLQMA